jgi:hypothetical protein
MSMVTYSVLKEVSKYDECGWLSGWCWEFVTSRLRLVVSIGPVERWRELVTIPIFKMWLGLSPRSMDWEF